MTDELASYTSFRMFADILTRIDKYEEKAQHLATEPPAPQPFSPSKADEPFHSVALAMGMDGGEMVAVMFDGLRNDTAREAFKRFIMLSKLAGGPNVEKYHITLANQRKAHEQRETQYYQDRLRRVRLQNKPVTEALKEIDGQIIRRWIKQMDNFVLALERYNEEKILHGIDDQLFKLLDRAGYIKRQGYEYFLEYSAVSCLSVEEINGIISQL